MNLIRLYTATLLVLLGVVFVSCDDNTDTMGGDIMPSTDLTIKESKAYDVFTQSYSAGNSVLARSNMSYLGRFTDPETGTIIKSDFITQFNSNKSFGFPDSIVDNYVTSVDLQLYVKNYIGDSLASFKLSVYPLNTVLDPDKKYYTDIDPKEYCDITVKPLAEKWYTIIDQTVPESQRWSSQYYDKIQIKLDREIGQEMYNLYKKSPETFENTESWVNSDITGSKGFYFKLESGDGAMAYIDIALLNVHFKYYDDSLKCDTSAYCQLAATEEIIQVTRFENSNLDALLADNNATYLKSPAGIFTMATLPVEQLNFNDTINSAAITFTRYNDRVKNDFKLEIPQSLLMVRLDDYKDGFFEKYKVSDNETSYLATFDKKTNTYKFSNISHLLKTMIKEKNNGEATDDYNKVLLIPVEVTYDSSNKIVRLCHDFSMTSARLVGGETTPIKLSVVYSKFKK